MQEGGEGEFDLQRCVDKEGQDEEKRYDQAGRGAAVGAGDWLGAAAAGAGGGETSIGDPCEKGSEGFCISSRQSLLCGEVARTRKHSH